MAYTATIPDIGTIALNPEAFAVNYTIKLSVAVTEVTTTLYPVFARSGKAYSGEEDAIKWP